MTGKLAAAFLLIIFIFCLFSTDLLPAASQPVSPAKSRVTLPARLAPVYGFADADFLSRESTSSGGKKSLALGIASEAVGEIIGETTYDYQHNCSMGRQVEHRGGDYIHFDWMNQTNLVYPGDRQIFYQSISLGDCGIVIDPGGSEVDTRYGGYVSIDVDPQMRGIVSGHAGTPDSMFSRAYFDFGSSGPMGFFNYNDFPEDKFGWYQNSGNGPDNQNLWPKIDWHVGTETVLHMVSSESGGELGDPQTISYYRRVGPYGDATVPASAEWSAQRLIDTVMNINVVIAASPVSDKVAIVWNAPADYRRDQGSEIEFDSQYENDIWYAISTNQGLDWINGIGNGSIGHQLDDGQHNITQYDSLSPWKAYCDISALITQDNNLHFVWGCRRWDGAEILYRRQSAVFHWSEDNPYIRPVVRAEWDTGGFCFAHAWGGDVAKMTISECNSNLYVLYTQFGNEDAPCHDIDTAYQVINGELYLTVSNDYGLNWDRPQNLTNSVSDSCAAGDCESDYWASMVRYGRVATGCQGISTGDVLDIIYINDRSPGGAIQDESGVWTVNPVMWLVTPCREMVPEPAYDDDAADAYGECYDADPLVLAPNQDTTFTITLINEGTQDNLFNAAVNYNEGMGWITISSPSGIIPYGLDNTFEIDVTLEALPGLPDPVVLTAELEISHEAENSPRLIPICLMVSSNFVLPQDAYLATACTRLRIFNTGSLVGGIDGYSMEFEGDCDTLKESTNPRVYLSDGSPIICRIDEGGDTLRFMAYSETYTARDGLRPISDITIDQSNPYYDHSEASYVTADTTIGFTAQYFMPKAGANCSYVIEKLKFYNLTQTVMEGVLIGEIVDWDIPSDSLVDNGSGYDLSRDMIFQFGGEYNQDDPYEAVCPQEENDRYGGIAAGPGFVYKNAMILSNPQYVYTTGPYGNDAPMPPGTTYMLMKENDSYILFDPPTVDSIYIDLSTLVTFGEYTLLVDDTGCVVNIFATTRDGRTHLNDIIDEAHDFIALHPEIDCSIGCDVAGDANHDGETNFGDVVYIINYIFKNGPAPVFIAEADANADGAVNVGDIIHLVNYVVKGGADPICPER